MRWASRSRRRSARARRRPAISYNVEASNLWAFFQAKTIRQTVLEAATEMLKIDTARDAGEPAATKAALAKRIDNWEKTAARYNTELMDPPVRKAVNLNPPYGEGRRELMARAIAAEAKRDTSMEKYHHYEVASAAFQIGIVLASATVITGMVAAELSRGVLWDCSAWRSWRSASSPRTPCICSRSMIPKSGNRFSDKIMLN